MLDCGRALGNGNCAESSDFELVAFVFRHQEWSQICGPALLNKLCDLQSFSNEGGSALMLRFLWSDLQAEIMLSDVIWKQFVCLKLSRVPSYLPSCTRYFGI